MKTKKVDDMEKKREDQYKELQRIGAACYSSISEMVEGLSSDDDEKREEAERVIQEDAIEVCVREDWHGVGDESKPSEFYILLSTGGPATRIRGELDENGEPTRAYIQAQDWGTKWTDFVPPFNGLEATGEYSKTLLSYCNCFYFGE